jgi:putative hydrolase of the HAD superfamily
MAVRAVILDFYGTLAEARGAGPTWSSVLAEIGYELDADARRRWWNDGLDGVEHDEHSRSRDHYVAWQQSRTRAMLRDSGVPDSDHDDLIARMHALLADRSLTAYDEVTDVLTDLRARGVALAICSNWDWDLLDALAGADLDNSVDVVVSSAWVGARKPHPRIYGHTLDRIGVAPEDALFVGDTWTCDVAGPRRAGLRPVYLRRPHFGADITAPADVDGEVPRATDLRTLPDLLAPRS